MRFLSHILRKSMFHNYERGTWPYDMMVIAVLIATFVPPIFFDSLRDRRTKADEISAGNSQGIHTIAIDDGLVYIGFTSHGEREESLH